MRKRLGLLFDELIGMEDRLHVLIGLCEDDDKDIADGLGYILTEIVDAQYEVETWADLYDKALR